MDFEVHKWIGKTLPNKEDLEKEYVKRKMSYYSFSNVAGDYYSPHSHDYNKLLIITKGSMKWIIDGKENLFGIGDMIFLGSSTIHEVFCITDTECLEGHY